MLRTGFANFVDQETQVLAQTDGKVSEADMLVIAVKSGEQSFQRR